MRMPFGKHKGKSLCEVPADYLLWLGSLPDLRDELREAVKEELDRRYGREPNFTSSRSLKGLDADMAEEVITSGYRNLAAKYHPDRGGNATKMVSLNLTVEALRKMLQG